MRLNGLEGKRITVVLGSLDLGGAERYALTLARYFKQEQGSIVTVLGLNKDAGVVANYCDAYGIPWKAIGWKFHRRSLFRTLNRLRLFTSELRITKPDIVIPYVHAPNIACGLTWRLAGAKLCIWNQQDAGLVHNDDFYERLAVHQTPLFISNSQIGARFLEAQYSVPQDKVKIVYAGVEVDDVQMDKFTWRTKLQIDDACIIVCMVANLTNLKDHQTLLQAWKQVSEVLAYHSVCAVLVLAGYYGDTYVKLNKFVQDSGLSNNVRFLGPVKDIAGLLQITDIGVLSSYSEGLPLAVLEYMAFGLPVVGSDIPGIREAVGDENHFLLAPPGNSDLLAQLLVELILNRNKRIEIGANNKLRIQNRFSVHNLCQSTLDLILNHLNC